MAANLVLFGFPTRQLSPAKGNFDISAWHLYTYKERSVFTSREKEICYRFDSELERIRETVEYAQLDEDCRGELFFFVRFVGEEGLV